MATQKPSSLMSLAIDYPLFPYVSEILSTEHECRYVAVKGTNMIIMKFPAFISLRKRDRSLNFDPLILENGPILISCHGASITTPFFTLM